MTPRRILVVDDVASMRMLMSAIVADMGHEVDSAGDGAEALTKCETFAPHLVIMDVAMPVMDGVDASRHILKRYQGRIPVVLMSGRSSESAQLDG